MIACPPTWRLAPKLRMPYPNSKDGAILSTGAMLHLPYVSYIFIFAFLLNKIGNSSLLRLFLNLYPVIRKYFPVFNSVPLAHHFP
jgi:hypothetical protein